MQRPADVELRVPGTSAYASVLRMTISSLAARLDFTIEDIDDLRLSVGEAVALTLAHADPSSDLFCEVWLEDRAMTISISVASTSTDIDRTSFSWQVLSALTERAESVAAGERLSVNFHVGSALAGAGR